ncbi:hypothetical protein ISN44_As05g025580 [Arabidopsis suecica]|uniref:Uncharacterized protein n=1 Tax=Arabidopsis suecica TaxID=45249 RepID=A0A8T2DGL9_ARASU|nr:hypothetical protein ISN44_As05g025580 [Arabidopsis suecica]
MGKRSLHKGRRLEHRILKEHVRQVWEIGRSFRERSMELLLGIKQPYQRQLSTKEIISSSLELRYKYEEFDDLLLTKVREIVSRSHCKDIDIELDWCPRIMSCAADNTTRRGARDGPRAVAPAINEVWCEECSRSSWACLDPALPSSLW